MGVILEALIIAVLVGFAAAAPVVVYRAQSLALLARRGARAAAYLVVAIPPALSVLATVGWVIAYGLGMPPHIVWLFVVAAVGTASDVLVTPAISITGGPRADRTAAEGRVLAHLDAAERHLRRGDESAWRSELAHAADVWIPTAVDVQVAIRRLRDLSWNTHGQEIPQRSRELDHAVKRRWAPPVTARRAATMVLAAALVGTSVATAALGIEARRACIDADSLIAGASEAGPPAPLAVTVLEDPEIGAQVTFERLLDLEAAADSRHDPDTREQLEAAGFVQGFMRVWRAPDGREIHASTFVFREPSGALEYQRTVTQYACQFSNQAFTAERGGIGLQVRWGSGDPIEEQIAWVDGARRSVVSVSHLTPPSDHARVEAIFERARRTP